MTRRQKIGDKVSQQKEKYIRNQNCAVSPEVALYTFKLNAGAEAWVMTFCTI